MEDENKDEGKCTKSPALNDKNKQRVSVRFHLQLTGSSDRSYPEFSYLELVGNTKKNKKKEEDVLQQDDDCNMDELRALAKKFEEKYAPKAAAKSKNANKTDRVQDLVDVTYGYDITDSFVDDSEAYDELVPADWTTEHGGFYINMGELNFRPLSSSDEKSDNDFKDSKKKIPKKKNKDHKENKIKEGKRSLSSGEKEKSAKKIKLSSEDKEKKSKVKTTVSPNGHSNDPKEVPVGVAQDKPLSINDESGSDKQTSSSALTLENPAIKLETNNISDVLKSTSCNSAAIPMDSSYSVDENVNNSSVVGSASVTLPEGLPPSLILSIQQLIEAARKAGGDGKCKFFNTDVNRILLQIETDSRKLNCRARSAVYDYLALFLPCTKETLLKRAKNLFMQEQVGRLREPLTTLRHAVETAMPEQIKHYEDEMAKHSEDQTTQSQKPCSEVVQNGQKDEPGVKVIEVEGENDKTEEATTPTDVNAPTTPVEEKGKRTIVPKRFVWKDDIRTRLCDVVRIKVELYLMSKSRSTTAEEALKGFLETEVRPIWPKGWMTTRILYRESKQAHIRVTGNNLIAKAKKGEKVLKKPKDDESTEGDKTIQPVEPNLNLVDKVEKPESKTTVTAVSLPNGIISSPLTAVVQLNLVKPSNQAQPVTCSSLLNNTTLTKPNVTGKTILDLLESNPGQNTQVKSNIVVENKPVVNQIKKMTMVTATTKTLPSCSFQGLSSKQLAPFSSPPRIIKPPIIVQSPRSSPNRIPAVNITSQRPISTTCISGNFKAVSPPKRLPSCSLMSSPKLPAQIKPDAPSSPVSCRQNYNYINNLPSSPSLGYKFQIQSPNKNLENIQRTSHSNSLPTNFMGLTPSSMPIPPLSSASLLNSIARSSVPQNRMSSNSPLLRPPLPNPVSIPNPLQGAPALNVSPLNIPSIIGMTNNLIPNTSLKVHGVFSSTGLGNFSGLQPQFANQPIMQRTILTKELNEGNSTSSSSYPPTYRPPFS